MHCSRRRLLRRELEFHVCTINKSAHTKSLETYLMILVSQNQQPLVPPLNPRSLSPSSFFCLLSFDPTPPFIFTFLHFYQFLLLLNCRKKTYFLSWKSSINKKKNKEIFWSESVVCVLVYSLSHLFFIILSDLLIISNFFPIGLMRKLLANGTGDWGSIPGRVIPKTQKMVLDTPCWTSYYKIRIKGKVEQSKKRSGALPYTSV